MEDKIVEFKTVEEQLLFSTLKIESLKNNQVISIGTGFLINRKVSDDGYKVYLVSNRHVLLASDAFRITFNTYKNDLSGPDIGNTYTQIITNANSNTFVHSDPEIDIAVIEITGIFNILPNKLYFRAIDYNMLATFNESELSVAQNVLFIGYPDNRYDVKNNMPIIRNGLIASHPKYDYNGSKMFIIDGQVFPGSSGSPVIINLTVESWKTGSITIGENKIKLLGVVAATMIRNNKLDVINTSTIPNISTQEVIGLGIVYKSTALKEIIDSIPVKL